MIKYARANERSSAPPPPSPEGESAAQPPPPQLDEFRQTFSKITPIESGETYEATQSSERRRKAASWSCYWMFLRNSASYIEKVGWLCCFHSGSLRPSSVGSARHHLPETLLLKYCFSRNFSTAMQPPTGFPLRLDLPLL